jgi:hypothetical protein
VDDAIMTALAEEHPATLRGTYYRVVSMGLVPKTEAGYRLVGREVLKLRRSGALRYSWITDGTRYIIKPTTWSDLDEMLEDAAVSYRRQLWRNQSVDVQVFTEKDAITGVISPICERWDVPLGILRGYTSETFAWSVAESLHPARRTYMYQLGDHDPSGVDLWRSFTEKVERFAPDRRVTFERLAVLPWQIEEFGLLTRPTKHDDTRANRFIGNSVDVDAIAPSILRGIVGGAITQHIDEDALEMTEMAERSERAVFARLLGAGHD